MENKLTSIRSLLEGNVTIDENKPISKKAYADSDDVNPSILVYCSLVPGDVCVQTDGPYLDHPYTIQLEYTENVVQVLKFQELPYVMKIFECRESFLLELAMYNLIHHHYPDPEKVYLGKLIAYDTKTMTLVFPKYKTMGKITGELSDKIAQGVASLHSIGVLHRDIKNDNVMMCGNDPVIIDFGMAIPYFALWNRPLSRPVVTPSYKAPELFLEHRWPDYDREPYAKPYEYGIDTWALAMMHVPYWYERMEEAPYTDDEYDEYIQIRHITPGHEYRLAKLVEKCTYQKEFLVIDPKERPSVFDRLQIPSPSVQERYAKYSVHKYLYPLNVDVIKEFQTIDDEVFGAHTTSLVLKASTLIQEMDIEPYAAVSLVKSAYTCDRQEVIEYDEEDIEKVFPYLYELTLISFFEIFYPGREKEYGVAGSAFLTTTVRLETKKAINYILDTVLHDTTYRFEGEEWDETYERVCQEGIVKNQE